MTTLADYGFCRECAGSYLVRRDGRIRFHKAATAAHRHPRDPWSCAGSGELPIPGRTAIR